MLNASSLFMEQAIETTSVTMVHSSDIIFFTYNNIINQIFHNSLQRSQ